MSTKLIELWTIAAGGGHIATANAIKSGLFKTQPDVKVNIINIREALDDVDPIKKYLGIQVEDFYNLLLKTGYTYGHKQWLWASHKLIELWEDRITKGIGDFYKTREAPDILVSCVPHFNRLINATIHGNGMKSQMVVVNSDLFDVPPNYWYEKDLKDCFFVCPTPESVIQAIKCEVPQNRLVVIDGVILKPEFYGKNNVYEGENVYVTVSTGGYGSDSIGDLASTVPWDYPARFIFVCGRNDKLFNELISYRRQNDVLVGYSNMVDVLKYSSLFLGKPGPASISEALIMGVPVLVENNKYTMVQERANVDWINRNGYGNSTPNLSNLDAITDCIEHLDFYRENVKNYTNNGLNDFINFLTGLL